MAERPVGVADQASGAGIAQVRTRERTVGGEVVAEQYVIPTPDRIISYKGMCTTFRTPGRTATAQNLFSIGNTTGSAVLVAVRRLSIQIDNAAVANVSWANQFKTSRITTATTNGTALTKVPFDTTLSSAANVVVNGDASGDGTSSGTTLTGTLGTIGWHQFGNRLHTAVGQVLIPDDSLIPSLSADDPVILRANEHLLVGVLANATAANGATVMYLVNCVFEEFVY